MSKPKDNVSCQSNYDSELMRWVTPDNPKNITERIGTAYGLNRYIFAGNNPLAVDAPAVSCLPGIDLAPETRIYSWWDYNGWIVMIFVGIVLIAASAVIGGVGAARACGGVSMAAAGMAALTAGVQTLMMALASALVGAVIGFLNGLATAQGATDEILDNALNGAIQGACIGFATGALTGFVGQVAKVIAMPKSCFIAGTIVKTKEGDKRIEEIEVGDEVWSYDEETGISDWKKVVQLFRNESLFSTTLTIKAEDGKTDEIVSTPGHMYYLPENTERRGVGQKLEHADYIGLSEKWVSAGLLKKGDKVLLSNADPLTGKPKYGIVTDVKTEHLSESFTTYNFEVEDFHTYFVGENGICVHNSGPCHLDPSDIRYTQDSISNTFGKGAHQGQSVDDLITALKNGTVTPDDIPPLRVIKQNGKIYSLDNRRLFAYKISGVNNVPVQWVNTMPAGRFTTITDGLSIFVRGGSRYL